MVGKVNLTFRNKETVCLTGIGEFDLPRLGDGVCLTGILCLTGKDL